MNRTPSLYRTPLLCAWLCAALCAGCGDDEGGSDGAGTGGGAGKAGGSAMSGSGAAGAAGRSSAGQGGSAAGAGRTGGGAGAAAGRGGAGGRAGASAGAGGMSGASGAGGAGGRAGGSGGGSNAGAGGALSTDRDLFFGDSRCADADVLLCEDFENEAQGAAPDSAVWTVIGTAPQVDTARAARGAKSLHVHTQSNGRSLIRNTNIFPRPDNALWGRMFVYIDALPTAPMWAHWTLVAGNGEGDGSEIRVGGQWDGQRNRFGVGTDHGPTGDWTNLDEDPSASEAALPEDEWMCLEWLYDGDGDEMRVFWDGVEHPSLHATRTDHGGSSSAFDLPEFESLDIGWWLYQTGPTPDHFDLWFDEIVLDDERIGCVR